MSHEKYCESNIDLRNQSTSNENEDVFLCDFGIQIGKLNVSITIQHMYQSPTKYCSLGSNRIQFKGQLSSSTCTQRFKFEFIHATIYKWYRSYCQVLRVARKMERNIEPKKKPKKTCLGINLWSASSIRG